MNFNKFQQVSNNFILIFLFLFLLTPVLAMAACASDENDYWNEEEYKYECVKKDANLKAGQTPVANTNVACDSYDYPWCKTPPKDIAEFVKQFYTYALAAVGVAALGAIIYGGVMYAVSAGNASRQQEAISWITGAVWGLVLLLGANLLLRTINPELKKLKLETLKGVEIKAQEQSPISQESTQQFLKNSPSSPYNFISPKLLDSVKKQYSKEISDACNKNKAVPNCERVITALIATESSGNPNAKSEVGALGIMQLTEKNGGLQCKQDDNDCIEKQINKGVEFLAQEYKATNNNLESALIRYNGGPAALQQSSCCSTGYAYQCPWDCGGIKSPHKYSCEVVSPSGVRNFICTPNTGFDKTRSYANKILNASR